MASPILKLKRYIVFRAHRALGIGPLFDRVAMTEHIVARTEDALVRAHRRLESQTELTESGTRGLGERIAAAESASAALREEASRSARAIAALNEWTQEQWTQAGRDQDMLKEAIRSLESRFAGTEETANFAREDFVRANRAIAAINERMQSEEARLAQTVAEVRTALETSAADAHTAVEKVGRAGEETLRQLGSVRNTVGVQADRIASLEAKIESQTDHISTTEEKVGLQAERIGSSQGRIEDAIGQIAELRRVLASLQSEGSLHEEHRQAQDRRSAEFEARLQALHERLEETHGGTSTRLGSAESVASELRGELTALRDDVAAQAARRHNLDARSAEIEAMLEMLRGRIEQAEQSAAARLSQIESSNAELHASFGQIKDKWPATQDELAQLAARLTGVADEMNRLRETIAAIEQRGPLGSAESAQQIQDALSASAKFGTELTALSGQLSAFNAKLELIRRFVFSGDNHHGAARIKLSDLG